MPMTEEELRKGFEEVWRTRKRQRLVFGLMGGTILLLAVWKVVKFLPPGASFGDTVKAVNQAVTSGVESFCKSRVNQSERSLAKPSEQVSKAFRRLSEAFRDVQKQARESLSGGVKVVPVRPVIPAPARIIPTCDWGHQRLAYCQPSALKLPIRLRSLKDDPLVVAEPVQCSRAKSEKAVG